MKARLQFFLLLSFGATLLGCGVRGDPTPPVDPPYISRGQQSLSVGQGTLATGAR
jgi:hypothetical protein